MESLPGVPPTVLASWAKRGLTWRTANQSGLPSSLIPAENKDFGPRLGFAYRLTNKTSIRGGYGEYFWTMPLSQILQTLANQPAAQPALYQSTGYARRHQHVRRAHRAAAQLLRGAGAG